MLILATWPLWWSGSAFPVIPLVTGVAFPLIVDRLFVAALLSCCAMTVAGIGNRRWQLAIRITALVATVALVLINQHRLQAWHWLFMLGLGASFFRPANGLHLLRAILASVYVCSALSRISATAHQGMSAAIVDQLLRLTGINAMAVDEGKLNILCHGFNAAELIVGLLLINPKTRRFGILSAVALHGTLLIALGPFGLRHHSAVLLWNLCFICLIPVVFAGPVAGMESGGSGERWVYQASKLFVWLFPLSGLIGIADNWPSWQLYSTRPEAWILRINNDDRRFLPKSLQPHVSDAAPLEPWVIVRLDRWSLAETESPLYPENRFQHDVICHVIDGLPDDAEFRIEISEPFPWRWWRRRHRTIESRGALDAERERFVFH